MVIIIYHDYDFVMDAIDYILTVPSVITWDETQF